MNFCVPSVPVFLISRQKKESLGARKGLFSVSLLLLLRSKNYYRPWPDVVEFRNAWNFETIRVTRTSYIYMEKQTGNPHRLNRAGGRARVVTRVVLLEGYPLIIPCNDAFDAHTGISPLSIPLKTRVWTHVYVARNVVVFFFFFTQ